MAKKKATWPAKLPHVIELDIPAYLNLRKLVEWLDAMPEDFEMSEGDWDMVHGRYSDVLDPHLPPGGDYGVGSMQVEDDRNARFHGLCPGSLVALVEDIKGREWPVLVRPRDPS